MAMPARIAGFVFRFSVARMLLPLDPANGGFFSGRLSLEAQPIVENGAIKYAVFAILKCNSHK
jgi:hypothetical protein